MHLVIGTIVFFVSAFSASFCAAAPVVQNPLVPAVFGETRTTIVSGNETLMDVARREGFGYVPEIELRYDETWSNLDFYSYDKVVFLLNFNQ